MSHESHYDHVITHHEPQEGFDPTEPHARRITAFVIGSVVLLVAVIGALQNYLESEWTSAVEQKVLSAPVPELRELRSLEDWRLSHYEYTTEAKSQVRLPIDRARQLFLDEAKAGKTFYPARPTVPKQEAPSTAVVPGGEAVNQPGNTK